MATLKEMRDAAKAWAAKEQKDIDSGEKKTPSSSLEQFMADKDNAGVKKPDRRDNKGKLASKMADRVVEEYSDLEPSKHIRPNPPAAAQSRMDANKPIMPDERHMSGVDLGEAVPGATKAHAARWRAITQSIRENRSEAGVEARRERAQGTSNEELIAHGEDIPAPKSELKAEGQRFTPRYTADPSTGTAAKTKSNIDAPHKDLGKITVNLIKSAGEPGSSVDEAGGRILRQALDKRLGDPKGSPAGGIASSLASKTANKLGMVGGIMGAFQARRDFKAMNDNPNYLDLHTGKIKKKLGEPLVKS
jgi:hypothetical protein